MSLTLKPGMVALAIVRRRGQQGSVSRAEQVCGALTHEPVRINLDWDELTALEPFDSEAPRHTLVDVCDLESAAHSGNRPLHDVPEIWLEPALSPDEDHALLIRAIRTPRIILRGRSHSIILEHLFEYSECQKTRA